MKEILPNIFSWSWFSPENGYNFNGHYILTAEGAFVIDPVIPPAGVWETINLKGKPKAIYLTNKHHTRKSAQFKEKYRSPIWIHKDDQPLMEIPVDKTFQDGDFLDGGFEVIQISNNKTPGESAFHLNWGNGILILGDALIGHPSGELHLLPKPKVADPSKAKTGLKRLLDYSFDVLLLGDGTSILKEAKKSLELFIKVG